MTDLARLLVPVALNVLVVNDPLNSKVTWARWTAAYENWQTYDSPFPADSDSYHSSPPVGVHLKWALPDALTQGRLNPATQKFDFPLVPNRWLVTRLSPGASAQAPKVAKSWLIESDARTGDTKTSKYLDPDAPSITPANVLANEIFIGRSTPLEDVTDDQVAAAAEVKAYLKAVGPGDVSFAAYQPAVPTVFSFLDDLSDLGDPGAAGIPLTYVVTGWHHSLDDDPLAGVGQFTPDGPWKAPAGGGTPRDGWNAATPKQRFTQLLARYQWSLGAKVSVPDQPPAATLYHALTYEVIWQTTQPPPNPNGGPDDWPKQLRVVAGSTATEALAALAQRYADEGHLGDAGAYVAELLEAAQYGALTMLDQRDGSQKLSRRVHDARFGSELGGTVWRVVRSDRDRAGGEPAATVAEDVLESVKTWLDALNARQRTLDRAQVRLMAMQRDLYGLWWKNGKANAPFNSPPGFWSQERWDGLKAALTQALPGQAAAVRKQQALVQELQATLPPSTQGQNTVDQAQIDQWVVTHGPAKGMPDSFLLKSAAMPRYWHANDPVILVAGIKRSDTHGADGRDDPDGNLACRLATAAVIAITCDGVTLSVGPGANQIRAADVSIPTGPGVPDLTALFVESVFLDPTNVQELAAAAGKASDPDFSSHLKAAIEAGLGFTGSAPVRLGFGPWSQPFAPLYLEWSVQFYPTYEATTFEDFAPPEDGDAWTYDAGAWSFDGTDYQYVGGKMVDPPHATYSGRTLLSAHSGDNLVKRVKSFLTEPPRSDSSESPEVKQLLDQLDDPYLLSQSLSGFTRQLTMWIEEQNVPPFGTVPGDPTQPWADLIQSQFHAVSAVDAGTVTRNPEQTITPYFFPIRAGFITFSKLKVIDSFGQVIDLLWGNGNQRSASPPDQTFEPILGASLVPSPADTLTLSPPRGFAMLRPRLNPSARLDLTLEPVDGAVAAASPVPPEPELAPPVGPSSPGDGLCGWLLPNHLDFGLSVFDAAGTALGELIALPGDGGQVTVNWQPAPGATGVERAEIPNLYLRQILESFAPDDTTAGANFLAFLKVIDETFWTIDPLGGRSDQDLSVLIGRPLAVLRARLRLELNGGALFDQSWQYTPPVFKENPDETVITWGYETIAVPVRMGDVTLHDDGLIGYYLDDVYSVFNAVQAGDTPYIRPIGPGDDIQLTPDGETTANLTMLVDPRAAVHAFTGLLPVKEINFPPSLLNGFLTKLRLTFRAGPVITDDQSVRIPAPAERHGKFEWQQQTAPKVWSTDPVVRVGQTARIPVSRSVMREGWIALRDLEKSTQVSDDPG